MISPPNKDTELGKTLGLLTNVIFLFIKLLIKIALVYSLFHFIRKFW